MKNRYFDGRMLREALKVTLNELNEKRQAINNINLFPIPDGDTGNNMITTIQAAFKKTEKLISSSLKEIIFAAYQGAREGSTGNSGAIFTQYLKGWVNVFSNLEQADAQQFSFALNEGSKNAYAAVQKPKEGTILTVAREGAEAVEKIADSNNLEKILLVLFYQSRRALINTSKILPELRENKVIDAGAWCLFIFISAILDVMKINKNKHDFNFIPKTNYFLKQKDFHFENPYDMEFIINAENKAVDKIKQLIENKGTELILQFNKNTCHIHIHTNHPLLIVEKVASLASISDIIIRNMKSQYNNLVETMNENKQYATVAFGKNPGFITMYALAGAELSISSNITEKKIRLLEEYQMKDSLMVSSERIENLSFKDNIILLKEDLNVLSALLSIYTSEKPSTEDVKSIANYPRIAHILENEEGHIININNDIHSNMSILYKDNFRDSLIKTIELLSPQIGEVLTLYYGHPKQYNEVAAILSFIKERFKNLDGIELYYGGQKDSLIVSIE